MMTPEQQAAHEAAIDAAVDELRMYVPDKREEMLAYITTDMITSYQRHMAETVRAEVLDLRTFAIAYGDSDLGTTSATIFMEKMQEAERALLELCGATELGEGK